jgi:excisionase family DNA binding protein
MPAADKNTGRSASRNQMAIEPISMRIPEACRYTGISRSTLYVLIARREVEIIKLGASTLVVTESLKHFVEAKRRPGVTRTGGC